jgi:hypothetical protein
MSVANIIQKADVRQKPLAVRSVFGKASEKKLMDIPGPYKEEHPSSSETLNCDRQANNPSSPFSPDGIQRKIPS